MSFSKMETFLEKHIEGFFNRKFASDLQFVELQKNVERSMGRNKKMINGILFAPNCYILQMSGADYDRICSRKAREMLYEYIVRMIIRSNLFIDGHLNVKFCKNSSLKKGACEVTVNYAADSDCTAATGDVAEKTIVIRKPTIKETASMPLERFYAGLTVIEGYDIDSRLEIGEHQIHIGRRAENEFLLTDPNASRLHAYITFEKYRHILYDADSLNGTFVNGKKITALCLNNEDVITIGQSKLIYEVL
ncbi:FhaA domain-containing protein [Pectinatus frisingensis]|jgi:hypothetical protein|uniref:FhaA domain-containing protein n=1 Tax=Pectinatus frisingensis TaxID=865 RepID=UPI0018C82DCB|nr:FhaA domain-containing protein [Pectinatus frisingensis]